MQGTTVVPRWRGPPAFVVAALALILAATGALFFASARAHAADAAVQIQNFAFGLGTLTIAVGDTVTWTNGDDAPHTASAEDGSFDSGNLDPGQSFSFTFIAPGTYTYRCDYHSEMQGTIVVTAAPAQPATPASPAATVAPAADAPAADAPAPATHEIGHQPDTALFLTSTDDEWPVAQLLIGLGIVAFAVGVVPSFSIRSRTPAEDSAGGWRTSGGWRR